MSSEILNCLLLRKRQTRKKNNQLIYLDYSPCGQAGDVGSVKLQATVLAQVGRVVGGVTANSRAWPWQVLISQYNERSGGWPRSFYVSHFLLGFISSYQFMPNLNLTSFDTMFIFG